MDSELFICSKCGYNVTLSKRQFPDGFNCHRCAEKSYFDDARFVEKGDGDSHSDTKEICSYCNSAVDNKKIQIHYDICDMYPIPCNFCNHRFIRREVKIHTIECLSKLRWCKFSPIGCQFQGSRAEIEQHENGNFHAVNDQFIGESSNSE
uniref:TRAF-type domain-containing protein n=1 Tax=Strigamia maritima TaxID=126957 RepID=T1JMJ0_STRMM